MPTLFIAYFGVRFVVSEGEDVATLEDRTDARLVAARKGRLKTWWGKAADGEHYSLLIGSEIGRLGEIESTYFSLSVGEIQKIFAETTERLKNAGFVEEPALHFQLEADA